MPQIFWGHLLSSCLCQDAAEYLLPHCQKRIKAEDDCKFHHFYEKHMTTEAATLDEEWKGLMVRIGAVNSKQSFPMKQGALANRKVHLALSWGPSCYSSRRTAERKCKSVLGVFACKSKCSQVGLKKKKADVFGLIHSTVLRWLQSRRESEGFEVSLKKVMPDNMLSKSP